MDKLLESVERKAGREVRIALERTIITFMVIVFVIMVIGEAFGVMMCIIYAISEMNALKLLWLIAIAVAAFPTIFVLEWASARYGEDCPNCGETFFDPDDFMGEYEEEND